MSGPYDFRGSRVVAPSQPLAVLGPHVGATSGNQLLPAGFGRRKAAPSLRAISPRRALSYRERCDRVHLPTGRTELQGMPKPQAPMSLRC